MFGQILFPDMNNGNMGQVKKTHPRAKFSKEEDEILKNLVESLGDNNWQAISNRMPGRNSRQCRERWQNYLSPEIINGPWTPEEDELLVSKYKELGPSWKQISTFFPTRTDINIKSRWNLRERHLKKEDLKIKKALLQKRAFGNCPSVFDANLIQNQAFNNFQNMQFYQQFPQIQPTQQVVQNAEVIKEPIKNEINPIPEPQTINSEPLPFFSEEMHSNDEVYHEINLAIDDNFDSAANDCWSFLMMNQENVFDQWF